MTEGCFINRCKDPEYLKEVSAVIIDEAHERGVQTDIALGLLKLY
jgi:HrpA-like RNA helicase